MKQLLCTAAAVSLIASSAAAEFRYGDEQVQGYVENNLLSVFYHELGHALVDIMQLPIFGQEEDAADVLSVFLIDAFWEEESAVQIAYDSAFGFQSEADSYDPVFWGVHGPDQQRYYNLICIFYGANPDERDDVAEELGLPEERAEYCDFEYEQAAGSWGAVMDEIMVDGGGETFRIDRVERDTDGAKLTADLIIEEVAAINEEFKLPSVLNINIESCGEANAWYDPEVSEIVMCTEFADDLAANSPW